MRTKAKHGLAAALMAALTVVAVVPAAQAKPATGPQTSKCGKLKKKAAKKRCLKQNQANRIAFNQIKNSNFSGARGDGEELDDTYCANGKWESRSTGYYGTGIATGKWWQIVDARVRNGGKWINAFLKGQGGYEIALQKRGRQWKIGIASLGRILEPGDMTKTNAAAECRTLEV